MERVHDAPLSGYRGARVTAQRFAPAPFRHADAVVDEISSGPGAKERSRLVVLSGKARNEQRRTGRRRLKTDDYRYAAQVYRDNFDDTPTAAVAEAFEVGIRRAGDIVAECRRRGFLPPTKQGKKKI